MSGRTYRRFLAGACLIFCAQMAQADKVVTILADFEDDSVAATITDVANVAAADCSAQPASIPARGTRSLQIEIGATQANAAAACDLLFRTPKRFASIDRVAAFCWIKEGSQSVAFRLRDARGAIFETNATTVSEPNRWVRVAAEIGGATLKALTSGAAEPVGPLQVLGVRVATPHAGRQVVFIDEIHVEHQVPPEQVVAADFVLNEPTRVYEPGSTVGAVVLLENRSRENPARLNIELAWLRPDGSPLKSEQKAVNLPASGNDYRATQSIDFSQKIDEPGLYRLAARLKGTGQAVHSIETTIAVTPSNRLLPRGRTVLFGVYANLFREPIVDQMLELAVARDLGVQLVALETPWREVEPRANVPNFRTLDRLVDAIISIDAVPLLVVADPPDWAPQDPAAAEAALSAFVERLLQHFGRKVVRYQLSESVLQAIPESERERTAATLQEKLRGTNADVRVLPPGVAGDVTSQAPVVRTQQRSGALTLTNRKPGDAAQFWLHAPAPCSDAGSAADAEEVLRRYVLAAARGVASLIWIELRDDDNDPGRPESFRGLVRRDFSPRMWLVGFAGAAGQLSGTRYAGPVLGAPREFESAMFIGSDKQVAVLFPRANAVLPGMLAPVRGVEGAFEVRDFERRLIKPTEAAGGVLTPSQKGPVFITLRPKSAQPEPQIALGKPWLRYPATVYCGDKASFTLELDAPAGVKQGFVQLELPASSGWKSAFSARAIRTSAAETLSVPVELAREASAMQPITATIRIALDKATLEAAVELRPMVEIKAGGGAALGTPQSRLGELKSAIGEKATATAQLYAAVEGGTLRLLVDVKDDKFQAGAGDTLLLGVAAEGMAPREWRITCDAQNKPRVEALGTEGATLPDVSLVQGDGSRKYEIRFPGAVFPADALGPGRRFFLAARYSDEDASKTSSISWGMGLDGSRSSDGFVAVQIAGQ